MKLHPQSRFIHLAALAALLIGSVTAFCTENILFVGNSFTFAAGAPPVEKLGGVPKLVEAIAAAKGQKIETTMVSSGGKDWGWHLQQPATETALSAKQWNWVVLQDYSTKTTHMGNLSDSLANAETFYKRIRKGSPAAGIVLYETWARGIGHSFYTGTSTKKSFVDPEEMMTEIRKGYAELKVRLEAIEEGEQVRLAPVGTAFALCQKKHPEINLYSGDIYHASEQGYYLSALVIYATVFRDSPTGATREFPGITFDSDTSAKLQEIAAEVVKQ
jgi:hypothetical protein